VRNKAVIRLMLAFFASCVGAAAGGEAQAQDSAPLTVMELFTSQGCSSCPPADALLGKMAQRKDVLALTMPVNYWDYLGWKDTLATEVFSKRQRAYAQARGDNEIYTPQMVINGMTHVVGSREDSIAAAIQGTKYALVLARVPIKAWSEGNDILVRAEMAPHTGEYRSGTVWVVLYTSAVNVDIRRGENYGKQITYTNVVRHLIPAGQWDGKAASFRVTRPGTADIDGAAAFLQADADGTSAIIGAAMLTPKTN
jgi:hypothetical protein